jgi:hypothetical protein
MPNIAFTSLRSALETIADCLILRFALFGLRMSMCLWFALFRFILPEPVTLKRLAAPRLVFILGIQHSYFALRIIDMRRPSKGISFSTSATSDNSSSTLSITAFPRSTLAISRPRNMRVTFNFAPSSKNFLP